MPAQKFVTVTVEEVRAEAAGVVSLVLAARGGRALTAWTPGAHVDVILSRDLVRQYSLTSAPDGPTWRIAVLREPESRGGSAHLHDRVRPGDTLLVGTPRNTFPLDLTADRYVFVAGGIGITPILPMAAAAEEAGKDWKLLYLGRSARSMAFTAELARYGEKVRLHRDDESGIADLTDELDRLGSEDACLYACGPTGLLAAVEKYAAASPGARLALERFTSGSAEGYPREDDRAFTVETRDGREIEVGAQQSVLDALSAAGIRTLSSCREGACGTCETAVLAGVPDHRDQVLSDEERAAGDTMMICVSRCRGDRLVLDV
ncbi:2Fe-2S iron-sulfur cluster-binding protein [Streptomyces sp. RLB1-33]|uniref:PDR/VanB family oxidoreductase n=1 Tax=Streptomyces mirabilis TaxID=68239 RepID=UPI00143EBC48|nr:MULTISPECIES: PDR/VanB family oxidoreductase [Streptomyces]QIY74323.1 oxidoreductase [Streptomyces sp. RLB1-33]QUW78712.1 oxidoreductase [Streptomyces mirabilis]